MIDEFKAILDLLGDLSQIGGWVIAGWLLFKVVILLSTTGAIVYCTKLCVQSLTGHLNLRTESNERVKTKPVQEKEIVMAGLVLGEGVYDQLCLHIKQAKNHVDGAKTSNHSALGLMSNNWNTSDYIHRDTVRFIGQAIEAAIVKSGEPDEEAA